VAPATITLNPNATVGSVVWAGDSDLETAMWCDTLTYYAVDAKGTGTYLKNNLYDSGVQGLAVRISCGGSDACLLSGYWPYSGTWPVAARTNPAPYTYLLLVYGSVHVELIKTGPITTQGVLSGTFAKLKAGGATGNYVWGGPVQIIPANNPTCVVSTPAIVVPLGSIPATTFKGVGSTSPTMPFNIELGCSGGDAGASTQIYVTLTDATMLANTSNVLSLAAGSSASGIGIQVLNGSAVLSYGPDSNVAGNVNQWHAGTVGTGQSTFSIPLMARYVQTGATVAPGSANGIATFTMSYQ
jgi:type 1 fimbria pilin